MQRRLAKQYGFQNNTFYYLKSANLHRNHRGSPLSTIHEKTTDYKLNAAATMTKARETGRRKNLSIAPARQNEVGEEYFTS